MNHPDGRPSGRPFGLGNRRRLGLFGGLLLYCLLMLLYARVSQPVKPVGPPSSAVVQADVVREHVTQITKPRFRTFDNTAVLDQTAGFIGETWRKHGFVVHQQTYEVPNGTIPGFQSAGKVYRNLWISYGPQDAPRLIVGAHYDVCDAQVGADDNASSVAALLEMARLLKLHQPQTKYRIDLVAFTLEEPPFFRTAHMGSAVHARSLKAAGVDVKAMIALDCIGYYSDTPGSQTYPSPILNLGYPTVGNFIAVVGSLADSDIIAGVKARLKGACQTKVISASLPASVPGMDFSDHLNYQALGYPAVMITDTAMFRNANYHRSGDVPETLDYQRLADVIQGLYAVITTF